MKRLTLNVALALFFLSFTSPAAAQTPPGLLDGVWIRAVENYRQRGDNQIHLAYGVYPLDPYYSAFDINAGYIYFFGRFFGWEVIRYHYLFTAQKDLTFKLARDWGANPEQIERMQSQFSTSLLSTIAYGKNLFFNTHIAYHRIQLITGVGQISTNLNSAVGAILGLRADIAVDELFSWTAEVRQVWPVAADQDDHLFFSVGTGLNF